MAELKKQGDDHLVLAAGETGTFLVKLEGEGEAQVSLEVDVRPEGLEVEPKALEVAPGATAEIQVKGGAGDRRHTVEVKISGEDADTAKAQFSVRAFDAEAGDLSSLCAVTQDLGGMGRIRDKAFARHVNEELRAALQVVKNVQAKLEARQDAIPDAADRERLNDRLNRVLGGKP